MLNYKFLILNYLLVGLLFGYEAKNITSQELKQLKTIDDEIYKLSTIDIDIKSSEVIFFIFRNISYDLEYSRLKINLIANAKANTTDTKADDGTITTHKTNGYVGINLSYPLFDRKEKNNRIENIIKEKNSITKDVKNYFKIKLELQELEDEVLILTQLEIRDKARKLDGVGGFNDWLKTINDIKKTKFNIGFKKLELIEARQILLNYVKPNAIMKLKKILK
jgi:hypothetical protein